MNRNVRVIICDDDEDDLFLIKSVLEDIQFKNQTVFLKNGFEVMETLQKNDRDATVGLILLDLNMPKMDGREVLKAIKSNPDYCRIPVVILTTSGSPQDIEQCYALGANCFISKPSSYDGLNDVIATLSKFWIDLCHLPVRS
ncbi:Response regulator rcp1 [Emticicia aquatica]|jgi:two-component system response regulator|uniref:Response regulator rcp1 n=1 Tax=Emticicia aquatica TaxID=1681835 RepID=A0ABN8EWA2_9BACT|nr:response regulator [Emticicia aquatica]CAH0996053.1 Response regulator rcp1 [Emticicia aquatica]